MMKKVLLHALFSSAALGSMSVAVAADSAPVPFVNEYLGDLAQQHKEIAASFAKLTENSPEQTAWIANYGTASPGVAITVNDKDYVAFSACEPQNCPQSGYVVILDPNTQQFLHGAVRYESSAKETIHQTTVEWLGKYDLDFVPAIWQQFYPVD